MIADGHYTGVLDRFEGDRAVVLLEDDGEVVEEEAIRVRRLPEEARRQDAVLRVAIRNGYPVSIRFAPDETERRRSAAQARFDRLAKRPGEDAGWPDETGDESVDVDDESVDTGDAEGVTGDAEADADE